MLWKFFVIQKTSSKAGDTSVFDVGDEQATSTAVVGRAADADLLDGGRLTTDHCYLSSIVYGLFSHTL